MTSRVQNARSSVTGSRPPSTRPVGEFYVNFADLQIGVIDPTPVARDLMPVRWHSATANYAANDLVQQGGGLYQAKAVIPAHAFNANEWNQFFTGAQGDTRWLPLTGGTLMGPLTITGNAAIGGTLSMTGSGAMATPHIWSNLTNTVRQMNVGTSVDGAANDWLYGWTRWFGTITGGDPNAVFQVAANKLIWGDAAEIQGGNAASGLLVYTSTGGVTTAGNTAGRVGISSFLAVAGQVGPSPVLGNQIDHRAFVSSMSSAYASASQGGLGGWSAGMNPSLGYFRGTLFAGLDNVWLASGARNYSALIGREIDVAIQTGASASTTYGLLIVEGSDLQADGPDHSAIMIGSNDFAAHHWKNGITFGGSGLACSVTGALIKTVPTQYPSSHPLAFVTGIDFSGASFSDAFLRGPANTFVVDGAGKITAAGGAMTGLLTLSGAPTSALHAATKAYVDAVSTSLGNYLPLAGGTVTGNIYANAFVVSATSGYFGGNASATFLVWDSGGSNLQYARASGTMQYIRGSDAAALFTIDGAGNGSVAQTWTAGLDINAQRNVVATGTVTGQTLHATQDLTVDRNASVTGGLGVNGSITAAVNISATAALSASNGDMLIGPGGDGAVMRFAPNYYWDWSSVDGSLVLISNTFRTWVMRASDSACYNNKAWVGGVGAYRDVSDERLKADIAPATVGLPEILGIDPINFHRLAPGGEIAPEEEIGFSAQNVQPVIPQAVTVTGVGRPDALAVASEMILAAAVNAIKTLNERVAALEAT